MLRRRVSVLRLGSRVQEVNKSLCPQSFARVRECRALLAVENGRQTQNCRHFWTFVLQKCQQSQGPGRVPVAQRSTVVTFGLALGLRFSKVSTVTGIAGVLVAQRRTVGTVGLVFGVALQLMPRLSVKVLRAPSPRAGCCPAHLPPGLLLTPSNGSKTVALKEPLTSREPALALGLFVLGPAMHGWAKVFLLQYYRGPCCWPPASEKGPTALLPLLFGPWQSP